MYQLTNSRLTQIIKEFNQVILAIIKLPTKLSTSDRTTYDLIILIENNCPSDQQIKLIEKVKKFASTINKDIIYNFKIFNTSEFWSNYIKTPLDFMPLIKDKTFLYDAGLGRILKLLDIHKNSVVKRFQESLISYVLVGSVIHRREPEKVDIDILLIIDPLNNDLQTKSIDELKKIILNIAFELEKTIPLARKLDVHVYLLTEFWRLIKDSDPIILSLLRNSVPLFDRSIFYPLKKLLKSGALKPSPEASWMYLTAGEQILEETYNKIINLVVDDLFYAVVAPSQSLLMEKGIAPPLPPELPQLIEDVLVNREKVLGKKDISIIEKLVILRRKVKQGEKVKISVKEFEKFRQEAKDYIVKIKKYLSKQNSNLGIFK